MSKYVILRINRKSIPEHRYVMEKYLGRKLLRTEIIHHRNGIKNDNRIENLMIVSPQTHRAIHAKIGFNIGYERGDALKDKRSIKIAKKIYELREKGKSMQDIAIQIEYSLMYCYRLHKLYKKEQEKEQK